MKDLIALCDGTWDNPDEQDQRQDVCTNVTKVGLWLLPKDKKGNEQCVYYHRGVGSVGQAQAGGGLFGWIHNEVDHVLGGAFGEGLSRNVQDVYMRLVETYEPDDDIYLFGFSRGAYTARSVAGFIRNSGLLRRGFESRLTEAYELYRDRTENTHPDSNEAQLFRRSYSYTDPEVRIKFIGVWDTVGALGIPKLPNLPALPDRYNFHDVTLSSYVDFAYQAVAIDEHRAPFEPSLWQQKDPKPPNQVMQQVWFAGAHRNVGGGYADSGLSDIALEWMIGRADRCDLAFDPKRPTKPNAIGVLRDSMNGLFKPFGRINRTIGKQPNGNEFIAQTAVDRRAKDPSYRVDNLEDALKRNVPTIPVP